MLLIFRILMLLCMLLAGWLMGRGRPQWQGDIGNSEIMGSGSCAANTVIWLLLLASIVFRLLGWPMELVWTDLLDWDFYAVIFLVHPLSWLQLGLLLLAYLASRLQRELSGKRDFE
jgi:hypothetical protein